jgi:hypothetical protein
VSVLFVGECDELGSQEMAHARTRIHAPPSVPFDILRNRLLNVASISFLLTRR